jgi:hypothetical protein
MNDHELAHELRLLFEERADIWRGYDGTDGLARMEHTRDVDRIIARMTELRQRRIDEAIQVKQ